MDTEDVTDMTELFYFKTQGQNFDVCLNKWDFSNVKNANNMLRGCSTWNNGGFPINFNTKTSNSLSVRLNVVDR